MADCCSCWRPSRAAADIRDDFTVAKFQCINQQVRALLLLAFRAFQPIGGLMTHDVRDFPTQIEDPDAVAIVLRAGWPSGLVASAQLGVPSAVASLGLANGTINAGEAAAIVTAAICSVAISAFGSARLGASTEESPDVGPPALPPAPRPLA